MKSEWSIGYIEGGTFPNTIESLSLKTVSVLAISIDLDEKPHYVAFHQGLHCLPKYKLRRHFSSTLSPN